MRKIFIGIVITIIALTTLFLTNPTKQKYITEIQEYVEKNDFVNYGSNSKMQEYGRTVVEKKLFQNTKYRNHILYSIIEFNRKDNKRQFGYGFLGKVFIDLRQNDFKKSEDTTKKQTSEVQSKKLSGKFEIVNVESGFLANDLWHPAVKIEIRNKTSYDIKDFIEVIVIFVDAKTGEQIGTKSSYIASSMKPFLSGLKKKKVLFPNTGYKGSITNLDITAMVYIEDELIADISIDNLELKY